MVGMGIIPLQFMAGENAEFLGLTGKETFSVNIPETLKPGEELKVVVSTGQEFRTLSRFDTDVELVYSETEYMSSKEPISCPAISSCFLMNR